MRGDAREGRWGKHGGFGGRTVRVLLSSAVVLATATASASSASPASGQGRPAPFSPNPSSTHNQLNAVSASSATDTWAVGNYQSDTTHAYDTLILHWDGVSWTQISSPDPSSTWNVLNAVRVVTATNAWAVGDYENNTTHAYDTLILHWNGSAWSQVSSPNPSATENYLTGVGTSSTSAKNGWAVGYFYNGKTGIDDTLTLRWNGSTWARVASPDPGKAGNDLEGVRVPSPTNAWAVGYVGHNSNFTLILHWNGTRWSRVAAPNPSSRVNDLIATSGTSPSNAWAVGYYGSNTAAAYDTLALHWNGTRWSRVATPNPSSTDNLLLAVRAVSPTDIWAVGDEQDNLTGAYDTLALHWNGTRWSRSPTPNVTSINELYGVSATSAANAWAVGWYQDSMGRTYTLILHWNGTAWSQV